MVTVYFRIFTVFNFMHFIFHLFLHVFIFTDFMMWEVIFIKRENLSITVTVRSFSKIQ